MSRATLPDMNRLLHDDSSRFVFEPEVKKSVSQYLFNVFKKRKQAPKRYLYAIEDIYHARQLEFPFSAKKTKILGAIENPVKVTPEDMKIARASKPIPSPRSEEDSHRYLSQLFHDELYQNLHSKFKEYERFAPIGSNGKPDLKNWSVAHFVGHDAVNYIPKESYHKIYEEQGWPESRRRVHERAIKAVMNPRAQVRSGDKHFAMIIGLPGAGKSTAGGMHASDINPRGYTTIDVDRIRSHLPEYEGWNATPTHQEAAYLTYGPWIHHAFNSNHHLIYDATGVNAKTVEDALKQAKEHDYKTHLIYVHRPTHEAMAGTWNRFLDNPYGAKHPDKDPSRFVEPTWVNEIGRYPEASYKHLREIAPGLLNTYTKLDPRVRKGERPIIMEHGRG